MGLSYERAHGPRPIWIVSRVDANSNCFRMQVVYQRGASKNELNSTEKIARRVLIDGLQTIVHSEIIHITI